jgi:hypothetical protein
MFHVKHSSWTQIRRVCGSRIPRYPIFQHPIPPGPTDRVTPRRPGHGLLCRGLPVFRQGRLHSFAVRRRSRRSGCYASAPGVTSDTCSWLASRASEVSHKATRRELLPQLGSRRRIHNPTLKSSHRKAGPHPGAAPEADPGNNRPLPSGKSLPGVERYKRHVGGIFRTVRHESVVTREEGLPLGCLVIAVGRGPSPP